MIEGPEESQDLSYRFLDINPKVKLIEQGITLESFEQDSSVRDLDTEFRLIRRMTETKDHIEN